MSIFKAFSNQEIIKALKAAAPHANVQTDQEMLSQHESDKNGLIHSDGQLVAFVEVNDENDVKGVLKIARKYHLPIIPQTTASSVVSGSNAISNGIIISTAKMNQIIKIDPDNQLAIVQPGVINKHLDDEAHKDNLLYAPDPGSRSFSAIGGNTNTNAGGASAVRFGTTSNSVLGMTVILADGRELKLGGQTYKDSFGYDLTHLFVGSEGTLGIVTAITVKLFPIPLGKTIAAKAIFKDNSTLNQAATAIRRAGTYPTMMQGLDQNILSVMDDANHTDYLEHGKAMLITKFEGSNDQVQSKVTDILQQYGGQAIEVTDDPDQIGSIAGLAMAYFGPVYSDKSKKFFMSDLTVPLTKVANLMDYTESLSDHFELPVFTAAYLGDGTVHPIVGWDKHSEKIPDAAIELVQDLYNKTIELNGTITGEYSVGALKNQWVNKQLGDDVDWVQQQIKSTLDPMHLLNPKRKID